MLSAGEIASNFTHVSRPAISRHLRVLKECGVVTSHRTGKSQQYLIDPRPLRAIREGWLAGFSQMQTSSLRALRQRIESPRVAGRRRLPEPSCR
jgi:DNA-binding transcriptional ArsR family regulator